MKLKTKFIFLLLSLTWTVQAGEIFKCEVNGHVRYVQSKVHCKNSQVNNIKGNIEKQIANKQYSDTELKKSEAWLKEHAVRKKQSEAKNKRYQKTYENWLKTGKKSEKAQLKADQHKEAWKYCVSKNTRLLKKNQKNCQLNPKLQQKADYLKAEAEEYEQALAKI